MQLRNILVAGALGVLAPASASADEFTGTLAKVAETGVITIGHRESSVPFSYLDENQQPVGYSIDLCMKIVDAVAEEVGKELEVQFVPVNPKTRLALMANGTIDLECGSTTNKLSRQEQVEYLATTFVTGTKLMVREDSGIGSVDDLEGKAIALAQGTTNELTIKNKIEELGLDVKVLPVRDHAEGMLSLETDRVDAYATDHILLYGLISKSKTPEDFVVVGDFLSFDPYGLMVRRDDSAFELVGKAALAEVFRSGEIDEIYARWFDPLGVPATPLLQASFELNALPQ
ncbi:MAG: amino acid ABC transporter substrate-binding protein [Pseudomonadota bacterium]